MHPGFIMQLEDQRGGIAQRDRGSPGAEFFRDRGNKLMCMIGRVTRFAMVQREIGLADGEPPTTRGYTPTVFSELPRLLERAGPGTGKESIAGLFTALIEGDEHNEPVADALRSILDGHVVIERSIAERERYPAVNVQKSVSRTIPDYLTDEQSSLFARARHLMSTYSDMEELIHAPTGAGPIRKWTKPFPTSQCSKPSSIRAGGEQTNLKEGYAELARILSAKEMQSELQSELNEGAES